VKACFQYQVKFCIRDQAHRTTESPPAGTTVSTPQAIFVIVVTLLERHRMIEFEEVRDESIEMIRYCWIGLYRRHAGSRKICLAAAATAGVAAGSSGS